MLLFKLTVITPSAEPIILDGELGNITNLDAISDYEVWLEGRKYITLTGYPRWSEPVRGHLARCIAVGEPASDSIPESEVPEDWVRVRIDIGINGGGHSRHTTRLAMTRMERVDDVLGVGWKEGTLLGYAEVAPRPVYGDVWDLALHGLNVSVWGHDEIPPVQPLVVPVYSDGRYVRSSEIPEPARSAFEYRQRYSGKPCIGVWDANWAWDWEDWLNGTRDRGWL